MPEGIGYPGGAKQGMRGTKDFSANQRPTNFGGRVSRKDVIKRLKPNVSAKPKRSVADLDKELDKSLSGFDKTISRARKKTTRR